MGYRALLSEPVSSDNVDALMAALKRVRTTSSNGIGQARAKLNGDSYQTLSNGNYYLDLEHGIRTRSGFSTAQLYLMGVEIEPSAVPVLIQKLSEAAEQEEAARVRR